MVVNPSAGYTPVGWTYTGAGITATYNALTGCIAPGTPECQPCVVGPTCVGYGAQVMVLGFLPDVSVAVDQSPPPVELVITWNGVPNTFTLTVPSSQVVGSSYPPEIYADQTGTYQFAYPQSGSNTAASWNLYVGPYTAVEANFPGLCLPPSWQGNGEWFWYTFTPNTGDWFAVDSCGLTATQPTYDITAMFEYGTSQIWFNHVDFNVQFLQLHKDISWCTSQTLNDQISVTNVGYVTATNLDLTQTFPGLCKLAISPTDDTLIQAEIVNDYTGLPVVSWTQDLSGASNLVWSSSPSYTPWSLPSPFDSLAPGETLTISVPVTISDTGSGFCGTIVFDSMLSATQIPNFKDPIALAAICYPEGAVLTGSTVYLYQGNILCDGTYGPACLFPVTEPILRFQLSLPPFTMTGIDPAPVPLIAGETSVTSADVALVRNMVLGLAPYDARADTNANGMIDTQDLAAYIAAAGTS